MRGSGPSLTLWVRVNLLHGCSAVSEENPTTPAFLSASLEVENDTSSWISISFLIDVVSESLVSHPDVPDHAI